MRFIISLFILLSFSVSLKAQIVGTFSGIRGESGFVDGSSSEATFYNPHGLAISQSGTVYVADRFNHIIRKITPDGQVTTLAGNPGVLGNEDGIGSEALFYEPWGICVDMNEIVYVADTRNNLIRKITPDGEVTSYAGTGNYGTSNGPLDNCTFALPVGIEIDAEGNIYVADHATHIIRKISASGFVTTLAGTAYIPGDTDGEGILASFNKPYGLTLDLQGNILVADEWNHKIRKITPGGTVTTIAGTGEIGGMNGVGDSATFNYPWDLTVDSMGIIYVADGLNAAIRKIIPEGDVEVSTLAGIIGSTGDLDGLGTEATFSGATNVAFSPLTREIFVADAFNNLIRKITDPDQGLFVNLEFGVSAICPNEELSIRVYPDVYDLYHFYIDGEFMATKTIPEYDTTGIVSGMHNISVVGELDVLEATSEDLEIEVYPLNLATIDTIGNTTFFDGDSVILIASFGAEFFWSNGIEEPAITVKEAGHYFVEIIDENGCSNTSDSVEITVRFDPDPIEINYNGPTTLCHEEEAILYSSISENTQWIKDNFPVNGATDSTFLVNESGLYRVQYTADGGTIVISDPIEIIILPPVNVDFIADNIAVEPDDPVQFSLIDDNLSTIEWNFGDPISGIENTSNMFNPSHQFSAIGMYDISVVGANEEGCIDSLSKASYIIVAEGGGTEINENDVFVATAFTPNGDGENDILYVRGTDVITIAFKVFNARGQLVFESDSKDIGWDGFFQNEKSPIGNYMFQLTYTNLIGSEQQLKGLVTLLR